jgi:CRISPR-associated endonuclease/helicase Cas3
MSELLERFDEFYADVYGVSPYPWQRELVATVAREGRWPAAIAAPTGAGKSSVIDAHVFLVAERERARIQAGPGETPAVARPPRRLVLVAPRRALVEDQLQRAHALAERIGEPDPDDESIVGEMSRLLDGLRTARTEGGLPLGVYQLRGGVLLDLGWRLDPARCQIICATPQMWGSRLLLRGYRGSRRARNLETGLLGHDVVAVIDEAHLHERLVETAGRVAEDGEGPLGLQVVAMSATRPTGGALRLGERDLESETLRRRVRAVKPLSTVEVDDWRRDAPAVLAEEATRLAGNGTVGVFVNTVDMALDVAGKLDGNVVVVCGRLRPVDVERLRRRWPGLLDPRGNGEVDYLVSTQSLEVGVDLDLPAVVSAIAPAAALAQRAGRLNRSGRYDSAPLVVVLPAGLDTVDPRALDRLFAPYGGNEIVAAAGWIAGLGGDASPERISASELPPPPRVPRPALTRVELETLSIAGVELAADPEVAFYVDEARDREERLVSIGARRYLDRSDEIVRAMLAAAPPRAHELASMSLGRGLDAVLEVAQDPWILRDETAERWHDEVQLRPGDVVLVGHRSPICTRGVIGLPGRRPGEMLLDVMGERSDGVPDVVVPLAVRDVEPVLAIDPTLGSRAVRTALAEVVAAVGDAETAERLRKVRLRDLEVTWCADDEHDEGLLVVVTAEDRGSLPSVSLTDEVVPLDRHGRDVRERLAAILDRLDAEPALDGRREQLLAAAGWHDAGKRHPRFQQRMGAAPGDEPLAKPVPGHRADRGDGWRHEQLSAAFAWARDRDPLTTIVLGPHHGHGLPLFDRDPDAVLAGWAACDAEVVEALGELFGAYGRYELERARLVRELGVHHLSYLEALLRCADMQVSREGR